MDKIDGISLTIDIIGNIIMVIIIIKLPKAGHSKTMKIKQDILKQRKMKRKILPASRGRLHENIPTTRKQNNFGTKYGNEKNITEKLNG